MCPLCFRRLNLRHAGPLYLQADDFPNTHESENYIEKWSKAKSNSKECTIVSNQVVTNDKENIESNCQQSGKFQFFRFFNLTFFVQHFFTHVHYCLDS